jgi:hypothetical protein
MQRFTLCVLTAGVLAWSVRASASNEDDFFVGDHAAITAGTVAATVADGSAGFYNPAGLASVESDRFDVSAAAYGLRFYSVDAFLGVQDGPSQDAYVTEFIAVPTQIAYVRQLSQNLMLCLGYYVPRAGNSLLTERLIAETEAGTPTTWSVDARVSSASYWLVAALGMRLSERVRFGFGLFGVYDDETSSSTIFGKVGTGNMPDAAVEYASLGRSTHIGAAPGVGFQIDLGQGFTLGLAAQGPRLQVIGSSSESINFVLGARDPQLLGTESLRDEGSNEMGITSMGRYWAALAYSFDATTFSASVDLQPGRSSERLAVDRAFAWNVRAGFTHGIQKSIAIGAGVFSDRSTADGADQINFYGATAGIEFEDVLGLADNERSKTLVLSSVFAFRYAYGAGYAETLLADTGSLENIVGTARHPQHVHELALHVGSGLHF